MIKTILKPLVFIFFLLIMSCNSSKSTVEKGNIDYEKEGYTFGIIEFKDNGNCKWIISSTKNEKYDPINIEEKKFSSFRANKVRVYFKFLPLRRSNRCSEARPIQLLEVIRFSD